MKRIMCLVLMVAMFMIATSCYALDISARIKVANDQIALIDQNLNALEQKRLSLIQSKIEQLGRIKELQSIEAEQAKIEAERLHAQKERLKFEAEVEQADSVARAEAAAKRQEAVDAAEKKRQEALAPVKEKVRTFANTVASISMPDFSDDAITARVRRVVNQAAEDIRTIAKEL